MSERLKAIVDQLGIRPDHRVLEIGCGHGVAATMVCGRLDEGQLTAIDRSAKMIEAAARRNAAYVEAGKAEFLVASLEDLDLGERRFDVTERQSSSLRASRISTSASVASMSSSLFASGSFTASPSGLTPLSSRG